MSAECVTITSYVDVQFGKYLSGIGLCALLDCEAAVRKGMLLNYGEFQTELGRKLATLQVMMLLNTASGENALLQPNNARSQIANSCTLVPLFST